MLDNNDTVVAGFGFAGELINGKEVTVIRAEGRPNSVEWANLHEQVRKLLLEGHQTWRFDLRALERTDSETLGILLTLAATIDNRNARSEFLVKRDSYLERTLLLTKLDQILAVISE